MLLFAAVLALPTGVIAGTAGGWCPPECATANCKLPPCISNAGCSGSTNCQDCICKPFGKTLCTCGVE